MAIFMFLGLVLCVLAALSDLRTETIPNALTYPVLLLAPPLHVAVAFGCGLPWRVALLRGGFSLLGLVVCSVVPLYMWRNRALGGGDVKLFAALGALLLPKLGFEAEACVFLCATLVAPLQLLYQGQLPSLLRRMAARLKNAFRPKARRAPIDPALATWFRLGPCFALGFVAEVILHWRATW